MNDISSLVPPAPQSLPPIQVSITSDRREFIRLTAKGVALELITAGFYRFWLATDIRRHLWSSTAIDGDAAEYTGRAKELLIGFLFAMAILLPIYVGYFLISIEAARYKGLASVLLFVAFYGFVQFAIYRARRYRLTRTVWRGVRFWMDGSGLAYSWRAMLWFLLVIVTLGIALPWRAAALERYKMRHSHYGELRGDFAGEGKELFKQAWVLWVLAPFALVLFPSIPFLYAHWKALEWRWWLSGVRFGAVRLESKLPDDALAGLYWKVIGWYLLATLALVIYLSACAIIVAAAGGFRQGVAPAQLASHISLLVTSGIGYLGLVLSLNFILRIYLVRDLWEMVLRSVLVHNVDAAANVAAKGELASALGEGLADGLDVAGF